MVVVFRSNTPVQFPEYPLQFPIRSWPKDDDPSFIGDSHPQFFFLILPLQKTVLVILPLKKVFC